MKILGFWALYCLLTLSSCVATATQLNSARQEAAQGHISILEVLKGAETSNALREQYRESERIQQESQDQSTLEDALTGLLSALGLGGAVAVSRLLSGSKPRLNEHASRLSKLEKTLEKSK